MAKPMIMTPGPTYIHEDVRKAMAREVTNPDLDPAFFEFYKETCAQVQRLMKTQNQILILSGEGILGLEAACASLIEPGDRVLVIDNGIFGNGFGDFVKMYGGEAVYFKGDYERGIDSTELRTFLEQDHDFEVATLVHCETPSGITNPVDQICPMLKEYGIISVVDSVSAVGGEVLETDTWQIDVVLGGSQKCLSAAPGLTFLSLSDDAWKRILNRETPIAGYYCNLSIWKDWYEKKWFPYTQPISELYGFRVAVDRLLASNALERHTRIATATRKSLVAGGLEVYPLDGYSNSVTAVKIPRGITFDEINETMLNEHQIMIGGSFGFLQDIVIRIGHMGENCWEEKVYLTLKALDQTFRKLGVELKRELHKLFVDMV